MSVLSNENYEALGRGLNFRVDALDIPLASDGSGDRGVCLR